MALNPSTNFTNFTAATADYPLGSSKNDSTGSTGDGTEHNATRANDVFGMQQALLTLAGLTATATADTALDSQYVHAMIQLAQGRAELFDDGGAADAYLATPRTNQQTANRLFEGQRFRVLIDNTNTGAATLDVSKIEDQNSTFGVTVLNIKLAGGVTDPGAGAITAGKEVEFIYRTAPSAHVELVPAAFGLSATQSFTSSGTYTPTPGARFALVYVQAPGGGGGGAVATGGGQASAGDGGGGGGWDISLVSLAGVASVPVTIGGVGAGSIVGVSGATAGGTTSFGAFVSCTGGQPGPDGGVFSGADDFNGDGANGGVGTGGLMLGRGGPGLPGWRSTSNNQAYGGPGGASLMSGQTAVGGVNTVGVNGTGYGQGGQGGCNNAGQAGKNGGNSGPGIIIVMEIF